MKMYISAILAGGLLTIILSACSILPTSTQDKVIISTNVNAPAVGTAPTSTDQIAPQPTGTILSFASVIDSAVNWDKQTVCIQGYAETGEAKRILPASAW